MKTFGFIWNANSVTIFATSFDDACLQFQERFGFYPDDNVVVS